MPSRMTPAPYLRHLPGFSSANDLVSCPRNTRYFYPGPEGCDENGPAVALLVGHVSVQICSLLTPCRWPILIATKYLVFRGQDTSVQRSPRRRLAISLRPACEE